MAIVNPYYYNDKIYSDEYYQHEPHEYVEERFRKKYSLNVEKSKRHYRHKSAPISYRDWITQGKDLHTTINYEREPLLKVYVSQEHYDALVERERYLETVEAENKKLSRFREEQFIEAALRAKNPTLQKAYEKYKMLLELAR